MVMFTNVILERKNFFSKLLEKKRFWKTSYFVYAINFPYSFVTAKYFH